MELESRIKHILDEADPIGLLAMGAPANEYDPESKGIARDLQTFPGTWVEVAKTFDRIVTSYFYGDYPTQGRYPLNWARLAAVKLWNQDPTLTPIEVKSWYLAASAPEVIALGLKNWASIDPHGLGHLPTKFRPSLSAAQADAIHSLRQNQPLGFILSLKVAHGESESLAKVCKTKDVVERTRALDGLNRQILGHIQIEGGVVCKGASLNADEMLGRLPQRDLKAAVHILQSEPHDTLTALETLGLTVSEIVAFFPIWRLIASQHPTQAHWLSTMGGSPHFQDPWHILCVDA